jgi:hypothetical protein
MPSWHTHIGGQRQVPRGKATNVVRVALDRTLQV